MMMNERGDQVQEVISTGSIGLDIALGIGGLPKGRVIEIYGPESSGKTTVATHVIAEAQKKGGICAIIDAEHAFDSAYPSYRFHHKTAVLVRCSPNCLNTSFEHRGGYDVLQQV